MVPLVKLENGVKIESHHKEERVPLKNLEI